jgi:hypothetical protein
VAEIFNRLMASRHADAVRRLLGEDLEISAVSPEIQPSFDMTRPREEDLLAQRLHLWSGFGGPAAVAANRSFGGVRNPVGSGVLAAVQLGVGPSNGAGDRYDVIQFTTASTVGETSSNTGFDNDSRARFGGGGGPLLVTLGSELAITGNGPVFRWEIGGAAGVGSSQIFPGFWILAPGSTVRVYKLTVNTAFDFITRAIYRLLRPEETTFA